MTITAPVNGQGTQTVPEKEEIWSTILTGVASSKMVPTKKILILGTKTNSIVVFLFN